jgi:hypothetical protein
LANLPEVQPGSQESSLAEFEIWVTAGKAGTYQHFVYFPGDLLHEDAEVNRILGPVPVALDRLRRNLAEDGIALDPTQAFFTTDPDDTVLGSEIALENHIQLAFRKGESHVHWILHSWNASGPSGGGFNAPALPAFKNEQPSVKSRCSEMDIALAICVVPCGGRNINYFVHNLYESRANRVISYQQLLTRLRDDLRNDDVDLGAMELVDVLRNMRIPNRRALINYFRLAIIHRTLNLQLTLLPTEPQENSNENTSTLGITSLQQTGESSAMGAAGIFGPSGLVEPVRSHRIPRRIPLADRPSPSILPPSATVSHTLTSAPAPPSSGRLSPSSPSTTSMSRNTRDSRPASEPASAPPRHVSPARPDRRASHPPLSAHPAPHLAPFQAPHHFQAPSSAAAISLPATAQAFQPPPLACQAHPPTPVMGPQPPLNPDSASATPASHLTHPGDPTPPLAPSMDLPTPPPAFAPSGHASALLACRVTPSPPTLTGLPVDTRSGPAFLTTAAIPSTPPCQSHESLRACSESAAASLPRASPVPLSTPLTPSHASPAPPVTYPTPPSHSPASPGIPQGGSPSSARVLRPRLAVSSKSHSLSSSREENRSPIGSRKRHSTRITKPPVRYGQSNLASLPIPPLRIHNTRLANSHTSTASNVYTAACTPDSTGGRNEPPILIDSDSDEDDDEQAEDIDGDLSSVTCDDIGDEDFEMKDCERVEDEESDDEHDGFEVEQEDLGNNDREGQNHDREDGNWEDNRIGEEEEDEDDIPPQPAGKGRRAARTTTQQNWEDNAVGEEEDEDDIPPQPAGKRSRAARTRAQQKRPRLASPIDSNTLRSAEGEARDNYLVGTITKSLSPMLETGLQYPAADESLSADDR